MRNDQRIAAGKGPIEKEESDRVWVWPDLVYTELISLVLCSVILIVWSIVLKAPLEQPANRSVTPNPSKAPWYFLGLQEMLVYFDPWLAGVVLPGLIIVGLIAIPYIDKNPKGNGYYTFNERKAEIVIFLFGFVILWVSLIVLGTFLRGPNWNFFGPFEYWDIHKLEALVNVNLSEYIWVRALGTGLPGNWFLREIFGHPVRARLRLRRARGAREDDVQALLREARRAALLRGGVPVPDDDVVAGEDAAPLALQPEVHRGHPGILLQHLNDRFIMAEKKGVGHAYNIDFLNVVFAASSLFLFLSTIWMVWDDYDREWKNTQRRFVDLEMQVTQASLEKARGGVDPKKQAEPAGGAGGGGKERGREPAEGRRDPGPASRRSTRGSTASRRRLSLPRPPTTRTATTSRRRGRPGCRVRPRRARTSRSRRGGWPSST